VHNEESWWGDSSVDAKAAKWVEPWAAHSAALSAGLKEATRADLRVVRLADWRVVQMVAPRAALRVGRWAVLMVARKADH